MSTEKDILDRVLVGQSSLQVGGDAPRIFERYMIGPDLPVDSEKRSMCDEHIREGAASELIGDFEMWGVHFPERDEPQEITTRLSCRGVDCIFRQCGLKIEQLDSAGNTLSEMEVAP